MASSFFVMAYVAISLRVVGSASSPTWQGCEAQGLVFAAIVAALALAVLVLLTDGRGPAHQRPRHAPAPAEC